MPVESSFSSQSIEELRNLLNNILQIRSIFPCIDEPHRSFKSTDDEISARCMLDKRDLEKSKLSKDGLDDVMVRVRSYKEGGYDKEKICKAVEVIRKYLSCNVPIETSSEASPTTPLSDTKVGSMPHPGLTKVLRLINTERESLIIHTYAKHSLLSVSRFHASTTLSSGTLGNTTGVGCKDLRLRFIIYQLLHAVCYIHQSGLCLDSLLPCNILLDDDMWLALSVGLSNRVLQAIYSNTQNSDMLVRKNKIFRPINYYEPITIQWIAGKVSNLEYLMAINYAAGRTVIDPLYHPLIPWVTDFSTNCLGSQDKRSFRDLRMTKFRLSKGDAQLETTYKHSFPSHNIPESLSELTYYIYMARRTPLHILRRVVRDVFVPEHYPQSMHRIYEWTPDECIPEFYLDHTVFQSNHMHLGLSDLELPTFAPTPHDFIAYHRAVLESDWVSSQLHHWIDLTFGYCLDGVAAVQNMNVPLKHTLTSSERMGLDTPNVNKNPGFVMLFDKPHPPKQTHNPKTKSHIFSFNNTKDRSESFEALNPLYYVNNSSKYIYKVNNSGTSNLDSLDVNSFLALDEANKNNTAQASYRISNHMTVRESTVGPAKDAQLFDEIRSTNTIKRTKKSLTKPTADSSLIRLKSAAPISFALGDDRCSSLVNNLNAQMQHYKFTAKVQASLQTAYELPEVESDMKTNQDRVREIDEIILYDDDFFQALSATNEYIAEKRKSSLSKLEALQMEDMFAVGCIIAELYLGRPLLSENDAMLLQQSRSQLEAMNIVYRTTIGLPLVIRRLVVTLIQPQAECRPRTIELLKSCFICSDNESHARTVLESPYERSLIIPLRHGNFDETAYHIPMQEEVGQVKEADYSNMGISFIRLELLSDCCANIFPLYFRQVYSLVGAIKMAKSHLTKLSILIKNIQYMQSLPLEGVHLALYHVLEVIGDSSFFHDVQSNEGTAEVYVLTSYWRIVDVVGIRLGTEGTEKLLVPQVLKFLNGFKSSQLLTELLKSNLWNVLTHRAGVRCFLRSFLPQLLTFVSAGTLFSVMAREKQGKKSENTPLWAAAESLDRSTDWLRGASPEAVSAVQLAAAQAVGDLAEPFSLGSGLAARYIVPSLLSLVGIPQLAIGGFEREEILSYEDACKLYNDVVGQKIAAREPLTDEDRPLITADVSIDEREGQGDSQDKDLLERYVSSKAVFRAEDTHVIRAVVDIAMKLGELVTSELILANVFNVTVVDLEAQLSVATIKPGIAAAIMEVVLLLTGLLPTLSPTTVQHDILQPSKISECCLPRLLSAWPLTSTWSFLDDIVGNEATSLEKCIESVRMYTVLSELCRLIVSASMIVGPEACAEYVLPHVDIFFKNFVAAFGMIPVESRTMMKAFELGAALYMPLLQLMGPEAFYTSVPNVNPRLDMWLSSIGSHVPLKSPPLPSNIWPEVTNEVTNQPEKKKGLMQWISGRSKWMSSLTSSTKDTPIPGGHPVSVSGRSSSVVSSSLFSPYPASAVVREEVVTPAIAVAQIVSVTNPTPLAKKADPDLISVVNTPHRLNQLLHRTPLPTYLTPTEGTELVEIETNNNEINRLIPTVHNHTDQNARVSGQEIVTESIAENSDHTANDVTALDVKDENENEKDMEVAKLVRIESYPDDSDDESIGKEARLVEIIEQESSPTSPEHSKHIEHEDILALPIESMAVIDENKKSNAEQDNLLNRSADSPYVPRKSFEDDDIPFNHYQRLIEIRVKGFRSSQQQKKRESHRTPAKRASAKMTSMLYTAEVESVEEVESREMKYSEMTWLLAGSGRWNVEKEVKDKSNKEHNKLLKGNKGTTIYYTNGMEWNPAAQMSMTTPKIAVDVANDATAWINFSYQSHTQFKLEDAPGLIRCMAANQSESLLMTCSRTGVRLWSLSSHPLLHISSYTKHSLPPFQAAFLRDNQHAVTCDGTVHLWDIESRVRLDMIAPPNALIGSEKTLLNTFSSMSLVSTKFGINPSLGEVGDDQVLATLQDSLHYYDIRCYSHNKGSLSPVANWLLPQLPAPQSNFISSTVEPLQLTCATSHEHYVYAGSSTGGLWILDRRMGRTIHSWQAHDGPVLKIYSLSDKHMASVSDRSASVWEYNLPQHDLSSLQNSISYDPNSFRDYTEATVQNKEQFMGTNAMNVSNKEAPAFHMGLGGIGEVKRIVHMKNSSSDGVTSAANIILSSFDNVTSNGKDGLGIGGMKYSALDKELGIASKPQHILYCLVGHKMFSAFLPTYDTSNRDRVNMGGMNYERKEIIEEEVRLNQHYFSDRKGVKLSRSKMQITSAVLLPLRRLLLLGTEEGLVRVIS